TLRSSGDELVLYQPGGRSLHLNFHQVKPVRFAGMFCTVVTTPSSPLLRKATWKYSPAVVRWAVVSLGCCRFHASTRTGSDMITRCVSPATLMCATCARRSESVPVYHVAASSPLRRATRY